MTSRGGVDESRPWLVTGASGLVGSSVARALAERGQPYVGTWHGCEPPWPEVRRIDLGHAVARSALLDDVRPPVVLHTAAMAAPGRCEQEPERAVAVDRDLPVALAEWARDAGAHLVHLSTDLVFDGTRAPYREEDPPAPVGVYATAKADAERLVLAALPRATVLRVALCYGPALRPARSPDGAILARARAGEPVPLFVDEFRTPIYVEDLAAVIVEAAVARPAGLLHAGGPERVSRFAFGERLLRLAGVSTAPLVATRVAEFTGRPPRMPDVSLDTGKLRRTLRVRPVGVDEGLRRSLARHAEPASA